MRAIQITEFGGPEVLTPTDLPEPVPGEGQQPDPRAHAGVNYADTHQAEDSYLAPQELPLVPGAEVAGTTADGTARRRPRHERRLRRGRCRPRAAHLRDPRRRQRRPGPLPRAAGHDGMAHPAHLRAPVAGRVRRRPCRRRRRRVHRRAAGQGLRRGPRDRLRVQRGPKRDLALSARRGCRGRLDLPVAEGGPAGGERREQGRRRAGDGRRAACSTRASPRWPRSAASSPTGWRAGPHHNPSTPASSWDAAAGSSASGSPTASPARTMLAEAMSDLFDRVVDGELARSSEDLPHDGGPVRRTRTSAHGAPPASSCSIRAAERPPRGCQLKIATWNVNSLKARLPRVLELLDTHRPDVVCLQETKSAPEAFPHGALAEAGYHAADHCGGRWAGVAILAPITTPLADVACGLPGELAEDEARWVEATVGGVRVASVYVPNGREVGTEPFTQKLAFLEAMAARVRALATTPLIVAGDVNVCLTDLDVHSPGLVGTTHITERSAHACAPSSTRVWSTRSGSCIPTSPATPGGTTVPATFTRGSASGSTSSCSAPTWRHDSRPAASTGLPQGPEAVGPRPAARRAPIRVAAPPRAGLATSDSAVARAMATATVTGASAVRTARTPGSAARSEAIRGAMACRAHSASRIMTHRPDEPEHRSGGDGDPHAGRGRQHEQRPPQPGRQHRRRAHTRGARRRGPPPSEGRSSATTRAAPGDRPRADRGRPAPGRQVGDDRSADEPIAAPGAASTCRPLTAHVTPAAKPTRPPDWRRAGREQRPDEHLLPPPHGGRHRLGDGQASGRPQHPQGGHGRQAERRGGHRRALPIGRSSRGCGMTGSPSPPRPTSRWVSYSFRTACRSYSACGGEPAPLTADEGPVDLQPAGEQPLERRAVEGPRGVEQQRARDGRHRRSRRARAGGCERHRRDRATAQPDEEGGEVAGERGRCDCLRSAVPPGTAPRRRRRGRPRRWCGHVAAPSARAGPPRRSR
jgi:exodeoxyribonuclease III